MNASMGRHGCTASEDPFDVHSCIAKRACNHALVHKMTDIQAHCNMQRWIARLEQGSEYSICTCHVLPGCDPLLRRFAQRSAWLLLERADEPFTMVRE